jgi:hypothetical protein
MRLAKARARDFCRMSSRVSPETRRIVAARANHICEYCLIAEADAYFRFQVEHIISRKHSGSSELENLALACVFCNRYKGSDVASLIPGTSEPIRFTIRVLSAGVSISVSTEL